MTLPAFNFALPIVDERDFATKAFQTWMASAQTTLAAQAGPWVPATRNVVTTGGLKGGGPLGADIGVRLYRVIAPLASLPTGGNANGDLAYALNGRKPGEVASAGTGVVVFWSRTAWIAVTSGAAVTS